MEPFRQRFSRRALITQREENTKFILAFKYIVEFFLAFLPQPFAQKESVFSFTLLKQLLFFLNVRTEQDCRKQLLRRMMMERKPHVSF